MNSHWENKFYRRLGIPVLLAFACIVILPFIFIDDDYEKERACQPYTSSGIDVKNNTLSFKNFIYSIKSKNGVLVLGTSESGIYKIDNYQGFLNKYFDCGHKFSYLAGAGRASYIYFPVLLNNKELFKGLKIVYFINPTYWRNNLNLFRLGYYERYNSSKSVIDAEDDLKKYGLFKEMAEPFVDAHVESYSEVFINAYFNEFRHFYASLYGRDDQENPSGKSEDEDSECVHEIIPEGVDSSMIMGILDDMILEENISKKFSRKNDSNFVQISDSTFQWKALKGFNEICKDLEIEVTYFLGPYNAVYCKKHSPEYQDKHEQLLVDLRAFLEEEKTTFIDGSDLSYIPGTFNDVQHHSEYGSWLIAEKIAKHYEESR